MTKSFDIVREKISENGDALFHCYIKVPRHVVKKNSRDIRVDRRTGRMWPGKSNELLFAERRLVSAFRTKVLRDPHFKTITTPVWVVYLFYFPKDEFIVKKGPRKGRISGRLPDLSNLFEIVSDSLEDAGIIENDRLISSFDLSRRLPGETCALEVFVFSYDVEPTPHLEVVKESSPK